MGTVALGRGTAVVHQVDLEMSRLPLLIGDTSHGDLAAPFVTVAWPATQEPGLILA